MSIQAIETSTDHRRLAQPGMANRPAGPIPPHSRVDAPGQVDKTRVPPPPEQSGAVAPATLEHLNEEDNVPGVIRLLEAGHFKGVADVRLRINFFDELSARSDASARSAFEQESGQLVQTVAAKIDELVGTLEIDDETRAGIVDLVNEFETATSAAIDQAVAEGSFDIDILGSAIQAAFADLVQRMTELLAPPPTTDESNIAESDSSETDRIIGLGSDTTVEATLTEFSGDVLQTAASGATSEPIDPIVDVAAPPDTGDAIRPTSVEEVAEIQPSEQDPLTTTDYGTGSTLTLDEAMAELTATFQDAFTSLLDSIGLAAQLPDPTAPSGNGAAYDRFLAIYNDLRGLSVTIDEQV